MRLSKRREWLLMKNFAKRCLPGDFRCPDPIDDSKKLDEAPPVTIEWPAGVRKPVVGVVRDLDTVPYWTRYRRFLETNEIPFEIFDIHQSMWREQAEQFDLVVWRPLGFPSELDEIRRKVHILEQYVDTMCYPSYREAMLYEDKEVQYELLRLHDLPVIDTFVSHSRGEALDYVRQCTYPQVWKLAAGSGSLGVELARSRPIAERWVRAAFSFSGRQTYWPYLAQKDYVVLQPLVPNPGYDVRVMVIGDMVFGFIRECPSGEFRASGMSRFRFSRPPDEAVAIARRVAGLLDLPYVSVDFLLSSTTQELLIIEMSIFVLTFWAWQLAIDGLPGMLVGDDLEFVEGKVWVQELALRQVLLDRWIRPRVD